jgi:hypothetical protein
MDCLKNLTACMGCTKKHAKCSWKEVREGELRGGFAHPPATNSNVNSETSDHDSGDRASTASPMLTPPHHGLPSHHQPEPEHHRPRSSTELSSQHSFHYDLPVTARIQMPCHSPLERARSREGNVEVQLQEAAKSSLAQANVNGTTRLDSAEAKTAEYHQPMVA